MGIVMTLVLAVQMLSAVTMIGLILLQHGKGADMGAAFGSGSSGSLFGASGSANFLSRSTAGLATVFFVCTLALAYMGNKRTVDPAASGSVLERAAVTAPAASGVPLPTTPSVASSAVPSPSAAASASATSVPVPAASGQAVPVTGQIPVK